MTLYGGKTLDHLTEVADKLRLLGTLIESGCCKDGGEAIPALIARIRELEKDLERALNDTGLDETFDTDGAPF